MTTLNQTIVAAQLKPSLQLAIAAALIGLLTMNTAMAGQTVDKIPFAHMIDDWSMLDKRRVVLHWSPNHHYIVHLKKSCDRLTTTGLHDVIGVSSTHNTIRPGFDRVVVGGTWCTIDSIERINSSELRDLRTTAVTKAASGTVVSS